MTPAPEYRRDPVTGRWAVVAPARALRPLVPHPAPAQADPPADCPFCPGNEHDTPGELLADRDPASAPNGPGWRLRVVPNRYPAVEAAPAPLLPSGDLFTAAPAAGRHEVVIACPEHVVRAAELPRGAYRGLFRAYRERMAAHAADPGLAYTLAFKNVGADAGASLAHAHAQLVATPFVPAIVQEELDASAAYHTRTGRCVFCDLAAAERSGPRRVCETGDFVAVAAFAPRFAYEVWVLPKGHAARYETIADAAVGEFAGVVRRVVAALDAVLGPVAFNWYLHTAPLRSADLPHYHWHLEIIPRTARPAGFEWGGGCHVTATAPERAAADLRAVVDRPPGS
ncbi:MAG TPA: HIT domain-containing protein [Urbifossiella sp.]|nr:HIT domain-containing protein [Urbifossiella sp.]